MKHVSLALFALLMTFPILHASADDLVLYLPFDDDSGNVAKDHSGFNNDATFQGNPQWIAGKYGQALGLDGATWGEVPDSPSLDITQALTMEAWALVEPGGDAIQSAMEKGSGWKEGEYNLAALYNGGSLLQARDLPASCADTNIGASIQDGQWHFLAGTWDGSMIKLYVDGALDTEMDCVSAGLLTNDDPLYIGARGGTQRFLTGALDELRIYDYARTAEQIEADMAGPVTTAVDPAGKATTAWASIKAAK